MLGDFNEIQGPIGAAIYYSNINQAHSALAFKILDFSNIIISFALLHYLDFQTKSVATTSRQSMGNGYHRAAIYAQLKVNN